MLHKSANAGFHKLFHLGIDIEMLEVGTFQFFVNLGRNLVLLSLPFYLYNNLGYQIWHIFTFFFVWQIAFTIFIPFAGKVLTIFGIKHSMALKSIGLAIFWIMIPILLTGNVWTDIMFLFPFFMIRAFCLSTSEIAYDVFITNNMHNKTKGSTLAGIQIAIMMTIILAPILGGLITQYAGFEWTTYMALICFLISGVVLFFTPDAKFEVSYTPQKLVKDVFYKTSKNITLAEFGRVFFDAMIWVVWPIFLILVLKNIVSVGILVGISSGISVIITFFIGKRIDKVGFKKRSLRFGAYRAVVLNILRGVFWDPIALGVISSLSKINFYSYKVPYDIQVYKWLHEKNTFERAHIRWFIVENTYTIAIGLFALSFFLFPNNLEAIFVAVFVVSGLGMFFTQKVCNENG